MATKTRKPYKRKVSVTPEEFVLAWEELETPQMVADRFGQSLVWAYSRAKAYRTSGVKLKVMLTEGHKAPYKNQTDVFGLNKLLAEKRLARKSTNQSND